MALFLSKRYPQLTRFLVNFLPVSTLVPVCCCARECNVTLFAVEYKKFRIKQLVMCKNADSSVVLKVSQYM